MAGDVVIGRTSGRCLRLGDRRSGHAGEIAQMDMPECKRELQRKREQRKRSRKSAIRSKPAHDGSPHPTVGHKNASRSKSRVKRRRSVCLSLANDF
jgi:hypothetical protein